jgi:vacuolar-type H+-ATPase subunit F/Vma7
MDVYVLGSREVVSALALAGLPGREIGGRAALLAALADPEVTGLTRILVIEEGIALLDRQEIDRMKLDAGGPLVVEIPGIQGPAGERRTPLDLVRRALGINL